MGDSGSIPLGFSAALIAMIGIERQVLTWWYPLVVFSPFWVDATVTLVKRLSRGEKVWEAHRTHYYQRLALSGLGHGRMVLIEYAVMMLAASTVVLDALTAGVYACFIWVFWLVWYIVALLFLERELHR